MLFLLHLIGHSCSVMLFWVAVQFFGILMDDLSVFTRIMYHDIQNMHQGSPIETLVRFLKARDWNVAKAHKMVRPIYFSKAAMLSYCFLYILPSFKLIHLWYFCFYWTHKLVPVGRLLKVENTKWDRPYTSGEFIIMGLLSKQDTCLLKLLFGACISGLFCEFFNQPIHCFSWLKWRLSYEWWS